MRKIKAVLRLRYELGWGHRQMARSCSIGQSTVYDYWKRAAAAGLHWPLPEGWDEERLERALLVCSSDQERRPQHPQPDCTSIHEQLQRHPHRTLAWVWEEDRQAPPEGYRYSRLGELYQRWRRRRDVVRRQEHKAGEKMLVDWAGATIPVHNPSHGPVWQASLLVAVWGASSYPYAEAMRDQQ